VKGYRSSGTIDKCQARKPDIKVKMSENIYATLSESRIMYGMEMWGLDGKKLAKFIVFFVK
jgi:hypothetical protein